MLLRNGTARNDQPGRFSGNLFHLDLPLWTQQKRNLFVGGVNAKSALPIGNASPSAWVLAQKAGGLSSRQLKAIKITPVATGGLGMPGSGSAAFSITTNTPAGQLISSGDGSATLTITSNTPLLTASIGGTGSTTITVSTNTPTLGAKASGAGAASITVTVANATAYPLDDTSPLRTGAASFAITGTLTPYAIGQLTGSTIDSGVLTADAITASVWNAILADFNENGTAGKALATAGSGGVDLEALAQAILAAAQITPIHADTRKMNGAVVAGVGTTGDKWRGV
jgi:hypothetical protein